MLIIGAPKCGTTSLFHWLDTHPEIAFTPVKEPHYFSWQATGWPPWAATKTQDEYLDLFSRLPRQAACRGEASTWYLYGAGTAERIRELNPDMKLFVCLRNPVDRAFSAHQFRVAMGHESLTFRQALEAEPGRIRKGADWDVHYMNAGRYSSQLRRYFNVFPRQQIKILRFETFIRESHGATKDCFRFLGLNPEPASSLDPRPYNQTTFPRRHSSHLNRLATRAIKPFIPAEWRDSVRA